ncbi:sphingolipid c9-methyltransferase protein [Rutstroemia sp. NJR-2017a WRK4]|nr:sphingolipid c9-methyltransferase protein [Rutstroemia sp. NJR-2017a WRK4]PQE11846.1 sphingolipid c9-methyltransferase protein [Rutstroemia sp. NJR-2017a WRK4]
MTTLDPSLILTSAQAFVHPLPQVRQFHQTLTADLDVKNARLRELVGGSYRELLGTAEQILRMRREIAGVEEKLGKVGMGCGRGVVEGMVGGLGKLQREGGKGKRGEELSGAARRKGLEGCAGVVGRVLRGLGRGEGRGKRLVVAAKVLVLGRLLAKSLEGTKEEEEGFVDEERKKLGVLRRRLLRAVDKTLLMARGVEDREDLVQALCAYSLATSSGARDVLKHFLRVRGEAITLAFEEEEGQKDREGILKALDLYTRSLLDVQALVPRKLSEALAGLKTKPLLRDETIRVQEGLRLDVLKKWFGDAILHFTPYVRHDDLEGPHAVETLHSWAEKASEVLLEGFTKTLQGGVDFKIVVELRTKILEVWIKDGGKARGFDPSILLDGLRGVVNKRLVELLEARVSKLHLVGTEMESTMGTWESGTTDAHSSLWEDDMLEMEIGNGATLFKQGILIRTFGRNDAVSRVVNSFHTWRHLIDEIGTVIEQLKKQRWDDDLEDIEDDESLETRNTLLSKEDPQMLQAHLDSSLEKAFSDLHTKTTALVEQYKDSQHSGKISIYMLRILRDIRTELPSNPSIQKFGLSIVPSLHQKLASTVSETHINTFARSFTKKKVPGRVLWEGDPELPVQPSPGTFKFLRALSLEMAEAGADLWSPVAVKTLKGVLGERVGVIWSEALKEKSEAKSSEPVVDGNAGDESKEDAPNPDGENNPASAPTSANKEIDEQTRRDILIQAFFDITFLQQALKYREADDAMKTLCAEVEERLKLEASPRKRIVNGAAEYWKRTSLLFGLLG